MLRHHKLALIVGAVAGYYIASQSNSGTGIVGLGYSVLSPIGDTVTQATSLPSSIVYAAEGAAIALLITKFM